MKNISLLFALICFLPFACEQSNKSSIKETKQLTQYVNTFIGTGGHGHTYPGASMPFGMVQLSPDTRLEGWDGCGGYHYTDSVVYGFSHTHLSGTGVSDYGDILLIPTSGDVQFDNGYKKSPDEGYASRFSHEQENASPGYYAVKLTDYDIDVALTVSPRVGFHQYTFNQEGPANVIIDLEHRDMLLDADFEAVDNKTVQGKRISKAWATEQHVYFYIQFSKDFASSEQSNREINGSEKTTKGALIFDVNAGETILAKVGISAVSIEGAKANLEAEIPHWDFEKTRKEADDAWNEKLNKIVVEGGTEDQKAIFYSALYHSLLNPNLYQDVDGKYRGMDLQIHQSDKHVNYTVFSLWDTFRGTHPLFTIIEQERTNDFIKTFLDQYQKGSILPIWELAGNYTGCMIGYHSIPVIADAYQKGIRDYDVELAFNAMKHSANQDQLGLKNYKSDGYIPADKEAESVSKTLEYAYDDWCIAQIAKALGKEEDYKRFAQRGQYYKNIFDPNSGFMRAKMNSNWFQPFDPAEVNYNYTEANSWQYSMFVPQDVSGMIDLYGGEDNFEKKLDELFTVSSDLAGRHQVDITGLIGQYAHGNEPSHHMAYLYNYIGKPHKTQARIREILETMYQNAPDGLSGNEDCGQMSSWYVLSSMGFYPVTPGMPIYAIGTPIFDKVTINLENGEQFVIESNGLSKENFYVQSASLNGDNLKTSFLRHDDIVRGGNLTFEMASQPNLDWFDSHPSSTIADNLITPVPYFESESRTFTDKMEVKMGSVDPESKLYYQMNGGEAQEYTGPMVLEASAKFVAFAEKNGVRSFETTAEFFKIDGSRSIELHAEYANQYAAGGDKALVDYMRGGDNYRTGSWQGYWGPDLKATVDLGEVKSFNKLGIGFLQDIKSWIFYPKQVAFEVSMDGKNFSPVGTIKNEFPDNEYGAFTQDFVVEKAMKARYVRVTGQNYGKCPEWHLGAGGDTWLFADEIFVE